MNERQNAQAQYAKARGNLILMIILTLLNMIMVIAGSDYFMLFSATVPYAFVTIGIESGHQTVMIMCTVFAVIGVVAYLVCWALSKKHVGWMLTAMIFFIVDTLALIGIYVLSGDFSGILDLAIHAWVMYYLVIGVRYGFKLKNMPEELVQTTDMNMDMFN